MNVTVTRSEDSDFTAVLVDGEFVGSISGSWALNHAGRCVRSGWIATDERDGSTLTLGTFGRYSRAEQVLAHRLGLGSALRDGRVAVAA